MLYQLKLHSNSEEYLALEGGDFSQWERASKKNELQYISKKTETVGLTPDSGLEVPDILYQKSVMFFSKRFKEQCERLGIDYLFHKNIQVVDEEYGVHETMYLTIVPAVNCMKVGEMSAKDLAWDFADGLIPLLEPSSFAIDYQRLGRYQMFRIFGVYDQNVYITEALYEKLKDGKLEGVFFLPCEDL